MTQREKIEEIAMRLKLGHMYEDEAITQIETLITEARQEALDYFYWRIDCNTLISELEGWRGCIDNAKDQTERHLQASLKGKS